MGKRQKEWARRERHRIKQLLGGKCQVCGSTTDLEFDCNSPRGSKHHGMDTSQRMSFYRAQLRMGNLSLLCGPCNSQKGNWTLTEFMNFKCTVSVLRTVNNNNNSIKAYASTTSTGDPFSKT